MNREHRLFVHRVGWAILPGFVSGLLVAAMAYGAITVRLQYVIRDLDRQWEKNVEQDRKIQRNREAIIQNHGTNLLDDEMY